MSSHPFTGHVVALQVDDIDTDQIIPARFLKTVSRHDLGRHLFHDWRFDAEERPRPGCALDVPRARPLVLVAGANFGCGSSREHAVWALVDFGVRAVVAPSFADIFRANALKNGLLPIVLPADVCTALAAMGEATVIVDLAAQILVSPDGARHSFPFEPFARRCLLQGVDEIGYLCAQEEQIRRYEALHPAPFDVRKAPGLDRAP